MTPRQSIAADVERFALEFDIPADLIGRIVEAADRMAAATGLPAGALLVTAVHIDRDLGNDLAAWVLGIEATEEGHEDAA